MPELPEVETVRRGLQRHVVGRRVSAVTVHHPRAVRRQPGGAAEFADRTTGRTVAAACRRGKYLWLPLDSGDALVAHLGMSGQLLVAPSSSPGGPHLRVVLRLGAGEPELRYVDQRTFGGVQVVAGGDGPVGLPAALRHIAPDPLAQDFDDAAFSTALRRRHSGLKRALLDQRLVSGIGNIYADEALWRAGLHALRPTDTLRRAEVDRLLAAVRAVLTAAVERGGTSFDRLYVDVTGQAGYFEPSLAVYGRAGRPCPRCGTPVRREAFMNRSSFSCPRCQPRPRRPHGEPVRRPADGLA